MWWKPSAGGITIYTVQKVTSWNIPLTGKNMDYELIIKQRFFKPWFQNKKILRNIIVLGNQKLSERGLKIRNSWVFPNFILLYSDGGGCLCVDHLVFSCHTLIFFDFLSWFYGFWELILSRVRKICDLLYHIAGLQRRQVVLV